MEHESYVSLETAQLLKRAGFDWKVNIYYSQATSQEAAINPPAYPCATLAVAQRWLRDVKHTDLIVWTHTYGNVVTAYDYSSNHSLRVDDGGVVIKQGDKAYDTYEEALSAGILKCLTLLKTPSIAKEEVSL